MKSEIFGVEPFKSIFTSESHLLSSMHTFENKQNETLHMAYQDQIQTLQEMLQLAKE